MHIYRLTVLYVIYKSRKRKDNKAPISCRITYLNKRKEFATGHYINPVHWDSKNQLVKPPEIEHNFINTQLSLIISQINQAFLFLQVNQSDFAVDDVFRQYRGEEVKADVGVYGVYKLFLNYLKKLIGKELNEVTFNKYVAYGKHLKDFVKWKYKSNDVKLSALKHSFIDHYEYYLKTEKNFAQITLNKVIQRFRRSIKFAIAEDYLDKDPFMLYKARRVKKEVVYLTQEELIRLENQNVFTSFTLPTILGTNLSGNEAYYTNTGGTGSVFYAGDIIDFSDFTLYPVTLYIYDSYNPGCDDEVSFELTIILPLDCATLNNPSNGTTNVLITTNLSWDAVFNATGYTLSVSDTSDGSNIVNNLDVGNILSYDLPSELPEDTEIFVSIIPYNLNGDALGCSQESFRTEKISIDPPKYFTPNNDGVHDFWVVPNRLNDISTIYIYDRYGKLLKEVRDFQVGWDGTFNNAPLPTDDYWYLIQYSGGKILKGHFTLKR